MAPDLLAAAYLSVDSALFVKRLLGIDSLPDVLALLDNVYYAADQALVDDQTVPVLVESGLIDLDGVVDSALAGWMRVLERPDIEVTLRGAEQNRMRRAVVARRGEEHVLALRRGDEVVIQRIWSRQHRLDEVVTGPLWAAMRSSADVAAPPPAQFDAVTVPLEQIQRIADMGKPGDMVRILRAELGVDMATARILNDVSGYSGQRCEIVMREHVGVRTTDTAAGVFVADTSFGRVVSAVRGRGSRLWITLGPGTFARFKVAISDLAQLTPSRDWFAGSAWPG